MKKKFKIKVAHIKGGVLGGVIGAIFVFLYLYLKIPYSFNLVVIGGFVGIFVVRKEIKLSYLEGLKIGLISALTTSFYALIFIERQMNAAKEYIMKYGVEEYIRNFNINVADSQKFEDLIINHTHSIPIQITLMTFLFMMIGTLVALMIYMPREKKMH